MLAFVALAFAAPVSLTLEGWTSEAKDGHIVLTRPGHPAVVLTHGPMWQLELDKIPQEELLSNPWLARVLTTPEMEGVRWRREQHPRHGALMRGEGTRVESGVRLAIAFGAMADGFFVVNVASPVQGEPPEPILEQALDKLVIASPALPEAQLPYGRYQAGASYDLELPPGIRALTAKERQFFELTSTEELFIRPSAPSGELHSVCTMAPEIAPVMFEPKDVPGEVLLWQTYARVSIRSIHSLLVLEKGEGVMESIELGDRKGWMWHTSGEVNGQKKAVDVFYTTWDRKGLMCVASASEPETMSLFSAAFRTIRVR